jgi:cytoskeletal protein RodZ
LGAFGDKLRKQREQRGIELDAISNTTKISTRMLRALEEERFEQLPGGVFNKGFVRAYARHVGLDEQEAIADYLAALNGSQGPPQESLPNPRTAATNRAESAIAIAKTPAQTRPAYRPNDGRPAEVPPPEVRPNEVRPNEVRPPEPRAPRLSVRPEPLANPVERFPKKYPAAALAEDASQHSTPIPWEKLAVALLLVAIVLAFWSYRRHRQQIAATHPTVAFPESRVPSAAAHDHAVSSDQPATKNSAGINAATSQNTAPTSATTNTSLPSSTSSTPTKPTGPNSADDDSDSQDTSASKKAAHAAALKPLPTFTLVIRATETSWISITADGTAVATETLIAPASTSIRATKEIVVRTGNAAGLTFSLKGKPIPTQGNEGEVKTFTFDPAGLHEPPSAQTPPANP